MFPSQKPLGALSPTPPVTPQSTGTQYPPLNTGNNTHLDLSAPLKKKKKNSTALHAIMGFPQTYYYSNSTDDITDDFMHNKFDQVRSDH